MSIFLEVVKLFSNIHSDIYFIIWTSLKIAVVTTFLSTIAGVPLGLYLAFTNFRGKSIVVVVLNTLMAVPTVVIGLIVYSFLTRNGSLGFLGILFTPEAIIMGQFFLALPIITAMVFSVAYDKESKILKTAYGLGANKFNAARTFLWEVRIAILGAVMAGFGRVIGEVGVSMMLGGNIYRYTRTITTAIALETSKGEFALGMALGLILLVMALSINTAVFYINGKFKNI